MPKSIRIAKSKYEFAYGVHEFLTQHIWIADAKSGFVIALIVGLFAILDQTFTVYQFNSFIFWMGILLMLTSFVICISSIFPRTPHGKSGLIFWEDILEYGNPDTYRDFLWKVSLTGIVEDMTSQNFYLSQVVKKKYALLRISIGLLVLSVFIIIASRVLANA